MAAKANRNRLTLIDPIIEPLMAKKVDVNAQHNAVNIAAVCP